MPRDKKDLPPEQIYSGSRKACVLSDNCEMEAELTSCGLTRKRLTDGRYVRFLFLSWNSRQRERRRRG